MRSKKGILSEMQALNKLKVPVLAKLNEMGSDQSYTDLWYFLVAQLQEIDKQGYCLEKELKRLEDEDESS